MKIKILVLTVFSVLLLALPLYSNDESKKEDLAMAQKASIAKRDNFYGHMETKIKFKKADIQAVREAGYSPFFSMMMLFIAREAAVPVTDLIALRAEGKSWGDMSRYLGLDYAALMDKIEAAVIANDIKFPPPDDAEEHADITYSREKVK